jgi:amino acid transporter
MDDPSNMDNSRSYSATSSTVTPLIERPKGVRKLPKVLDSFRSDPNNEIVTAYDVGKNGFRSFNPKQAAFNTANTPLVRRLKGRHLQMIAIGGSIGEAYHLFCFLKDIADSSQVLACSSAQGSLWQ